MNSIKISVKTSKGENFNLNLLPFSTIKTVKEKIMKIIGIPLNEQILLYNALSLNDINKNLSDYGIKDNSIIILAHKYNEDIIEDEAVKNSNVIPLYNPKLNLFPTIILCVDFDCTINEDLYNNLKKELSEIIDKNNFSIIELKKGSIIMKIVLIADLAIKGIKASEYNQTSEEINSILKKIESKKFVCLGNNYSNDISYNIPNYSENENRIRLVNFLKEISKSNEDILQTSSTMTNEEF